MPLVVDGRYITDSWPAADGDGDVSRRVYCATELGALDDAAFAAFPDRLGATVGEMADVAAIEQRLERFALLVIDFPRASDGRGFSLARRLRQLGYHDELRARGPLIPDQYPHLRAVGFDSIEVPTDGIERHTELAWRKAWLSFPNRYQSAYAGLSSILGARHSLAVQAIDG